MAKGVMIALSNPVSAEREDEFNDWYNNVHGPEVTALDGIAAMVRFKTVAQVVPPADTPAFSYLTVYELEDIDQAVRSLAENREAFQMSPAVDLDRALGLCFQQIFSTDSR